MSPQEQADCLKPCEHVLLDENEAKDRATQLLVKMRGERKKRKEEEEEDATACIASA